MQLSHFGINASKPRLLANFQDTRIVSLNTRSGCGITIATRPLELSAVIPSADPFGFAGYISVGFN